MSQTSGSERPRGARFFDRFTDPFSDLARDKLTQVEDKVRSSIQAEIDAVGRSVRSRALHLRPSALLFAAAGLLTLFALALFVGAAVVGLAHAVELWLALLLIGVALVLLAAAFAAWGRHRLPLPVHTAVPEPHPAPDELVHPWAD